MTPFPALLLALLLLPGGSAPDDRTKRIITSEEAYSANPPRLTAPLPSILRWEDDHRYVQQMTTGPDSGRAMLIHARTGEVAGPAPESMPQETLAAMLPRGIPPQRRAAADEARGVYIYVHENDLHMLDATRRIFRRLTTGPDPEKNPTLSPDGARVAFTRNNDLFVVTLATGEERRITTDGSDRILNGWASWVYWEEIFGRGTRNRAFWWSPAGTHLAFFRFDESRVPTQPLFNAAGQRGTLTFQRYPKAGDPNPEALLAVADVRTGAITRAAFDPTRDQYLGTPFWRPDGSGLVAQWMNRGQDSLLLYDVEIATGELRLLCTEHQLTWVDWYEEMTFLADGGFILRSDRDGWAHFYRFNRSGRLLNRVTSGEWAVEKILRVDDDAGTMWFTGKREATTRTDLYRIGLDGSGLTRLTFGAYTHSVRLPPGGTLFLTTYSSVSSPPRLAVAENGAPVREVGTAATPLLEEYNLARTEIVQIPTADGWSIPAALTLPPVLEPGRRYPVLLSTYGGPADGSVADGWRLTLSTQALAADGLVSMSIDHRGSGHHGKKGEALMHRRLGTWEVHDYVEAVKWLRRQPWADSTRVGITGASYGGYVAALALAAAPEYFTHGIASFPVIDWLLYDSHYTERYMDSPADNPEGYREASVLTHAHGMLGLLRLVQGAMDDNVHLQNVLQLADTLQDLAKQFELMVYPDQGHGIAPPKAEHARQENLRFYYRHLLNTPVPEAALRTRTRSRTMPPH